VWISAFTRQGPRDHLRRIHRPGRGHHGPHDRHLQDRGGSFQVKHGPGHGKQSFNPRTCLSNINERGNYTLGHGTGKYAGISGHGTYHLIVLLIATRNSKGQCSQTKLPLAFQQISTGSGPVHL
jgi:hypothetical protein